MAPYRLAAGAAVGLVLGLATLAVGVRAPAETEQGLSRSEALVLGLLMVASSGAVLYLST